MGMKTTLELPDHLLREIKILGAERGFTMREFITQAVMDRLARMKSSADKPWMSGFGTLAHLREETAHVQEEVNEAFGHADPEEWR